MYNFFTMFFFGKNLKFKHKATICLAALGILANIWVCTKKRFGTFPFYIEFYNGEIIFHTTKIVLSFGILIKMLVIAFFRKF